MEQELHRSYHYHHQNQIHTQILLEIKNVCYSLNAFNLPGQKDIVLREKLPLHTHTLSLSPTHSNELYGCPANFKQSNLYKSSIVRLFYVHIPLNNVTSMHGFAKIITYMSF